MHIVRLIISAVFSFAANVLPVFTTHVGPALDAIARIADSAEDIADYFKNQTKLPKSEQAFRREVNRALRAMLPAEVEKQTAHADLIANYRAHVASLPPALANAVLMKTASLLLRAIYYDEGKNREMSESQADMLAQFAYTARKNGLPLA